MMAAALTMLLSACLCGAYLVLARRWQLLALPNERSSHQLPTPHGGGVPIFVAVILGTLLAGYMGVRWDGVYLLLLAVAGMLVAIGVWDDLRGLSSGLRLAVYALCCVVTVDALHPFIQAQALMPVVLGLIAVVALLWMINLYNFMDGIDAFAAVQCILACIGAALIAWQRGADPGYLQFCLILMAAHMGFLVWNWPPARLFMGDAGSIPTGFLLGALALLGSVRGYLPISAWLILLGIFIVDASVTLIWRVASGQPFWSPHRLHCYQRLSRHFGGHLPVVFLLLAVGSLWLFPLALLSAVYPKYWVLLVILAYVPLLAGMAKAAKLG